MSEMKELDRVLTAITDLAVSQEIAQPFLQDSSEFIHDLLIDRLREVVIEEYKEEEKCKILSSIQPKDGLATIATIAEFNELATGEVDSMTNIRLDALYTALDQLEKHKEYGTSIDFEVCDFLYDLAWDELVEIKMKELEQY